ncbi:hypothetical protein LR032_01500 [Candidatus Bipolaricaulota bacterium]|nr:hypothetical protein [Candidatus Bipolaricaulota bacterium]
MKNENCKIEAFSLARSLRALKPQKSLRKPSFISVCVSFPSSAVLCIFASLRDTNFSFVFMKFFLYAARRNIRGRVLVRLFAAACRLPVRIRAAGLGERKDRNSYTFKQRSSEN